MRKLPIINLAGTDFTVDVRMGELRNTTAPYNSIPFRSMEPTTDGYHYTFWYDKKAKGIHLNQVDVKDIPDQLIKLQIPWEIRLDPVGVALHKNLPSNILNHYYPQQERFEATILQTKQENQIIQRIHNTKQKIIKALSNNKKLKR